MSLIQTPSFTELFHRIRLRSRFIWQFLHQSPKDVRQTVRLYISKASLKKKKPKTTKPKSYSKRLWFIAAQDVCCIFLDYFNIDLFVTSALCLLVHCIFP